MKVLYYRKNGEPKDVLELIELPKPEPKSTEVLVKLNLVAVNQSDTATIRGVYKCTQKCPAIPGYDGVGEVIQIGAEVKGIQVGDQIIKTTETIVGWSNGTWQEYACWDESAVFPVPKELDPAYAAQLYISLLPAYVVAVSDLQLGSDQTLLITAGGSSLGRVILQLSKLRGFSVISVVRRPEEVPEIKALGATHVICSSTENITQKTLEYTNLKGVNAVIECVGGEIATKCFNAIAPGGRMIVFGMLNNQRESTFDLRKMLYSSIAVQGWWLGHWWFNTSDETRSKAMNRVIELIISGSIQPQKALVFAVEDYRKAIDAIEGTQRIGRALIKF